MGISGRLDDVSIAEVMQFIHLGKRSGVLYVEGDGNAEVHFHEGRLVAAHGDRVQRLGELLVRHGAIAPQVLLEAVERQRKEETDQVLGEVLLSMGAVTQDELSRVVQLHIQDTIQDILGWRRGTFRFELGQVKPIRGFQRSLGQILPAINLNTQRILLEAARLMDEAGREGELDGDEAAPETSEASETKDYDTGVHKTISASDEPPESTTASETLVEADASSTESPVAVDSDAGASFEQIYIVSSDDNFVERLSGRLGRESIWLERLHPESTEPIEAESDRLFILIDSTVEATEKTIEKLLGRNPGAVPIAVVDPSTPEDYVATLGAFSIVDRDVDAIASRCLELGREPTERPSNGRPGKGLLHRLRRLSAEIRTGALAANATLALLNTLAECSERTVLFAVRDDVLKAIGGFGFSTHNGRPIVEVIRGLTLSVDEADSLAAPVTGQEACELRFDTDPLPADFLRLVGAPESGQGAVFPVSGTEKVILLVYADNGNREVEELDLMTLAADQVGVAIENEFLRYRLARS